MKPKGKSYSNARKIVVNGNVFDSKFEAERYQELLLLEQAGLIYKLKRQEAFPLENEAVCIRELRGNNTRKYTADFSYLEKTNSTNNLHQSVKVVEETIVKVVEETKGRMLAIDSLRISIFKALYPNIDFRLIKQKKRRSSTSKKRLTKK